MKLDCGWDSIKVELDPDVFGLADNQADAFEGDAKPTLKDGKWKLDCALGTCGMKSSSTIIKKDEYIAFSFNVAAAQGSRTINGVEVFITSKWGAQIEN